MKTLNTLEIQNVSGGLHRSLVYSVLALPFIGAVQGAAGAFALNGRCHETPVEHIVMGMGIGFSMGLGAAINLSNRNHI